MSGPKSKEASGLVSPAGKQIKEWEAGFRGLQRKSVPMAKDYGYGGAEESEALSKPSKPILPFLGEQHMNQARTRAQTAKKKQAVERTRQQLEESEKAIGDMNRAMIRKFKAMPGKDPIPGQEKSLASEGARFSSVPTYGEMKKVPEAPKSSHADPGGSRDWEDYHTKMSSMHKRMAGQAPDRSVQEAHNTAADSHDRAVKTIRESNRRVGERKMIGEAIGERHRTAPQVGAMKNHSRRAMTASENAFRSEQTMKSMSMINNMLSKAAPGSESKKRKKTNRDREEDRKTALAKMKRMVEHIGKGCKGARLSPDPAAKGGEMKKDMEHLTGEYQKPAYQPKQMTPAHRAEVGFGPSAAEEGPAAKKQAMSGASPGVAAPKLSANAPNPFHESKPPMPLGVEKEAPTVQVKQAKPMAAVAGGKPVAGSHEEGDIMTSVPKHFKSLTKSAIVDLMISKAQSSEMSPGNPANENGPVHGSVHGGKGPAQTSVSENPDEQSPGNPANEQKSVSGAAHAGKGPSQGPVSGTPHGGKGPARTSIPADGQDQFPGNPSQMNKAIGAAAVPRLPRAMAMSMDTWRSATNVMTRANSAIDKHFTHHGAGPLFPETAQFIEDEAQDRATRKPEMIKSCGACGRTYHIVKSMDEPCPTCSKNASSCMSKGRGGILIPSFIED